MIASRHYISAVWIVAGAKEPSWGAWHEGFGLKEPAHAFIIDRAGKIDAEGEIDRMAKRALHLARQE
ncbi:MAG: hypothetical protein ACREHD_11455 [Pirellulales bacterium]